MATKTDSQLTTIATLIQDEIVVGANDEARVGGFLIEVVENKINKDKIDVDATMAANSDTLLPSQKAVKTALALKVQYKCYVNVITQASTSAPSGTAIKNDFSVAVVLSRTSTGIYLATISSSEFTSGKTISLVTHSTNGTGIIGTVWVDANNVQIVTRNFSGTLTDGIMTACSFKIEVYP